jgi:NAD-dependent SIR2 family protein deacetylase
VPNAAHGALAALERAGRVANLVTQNVDGLHQRAGSRRVIDLHGRLDRVVCLACPVTLERATIQAAMERANPLFAGCAGALAPDGDAELDDCAGFEPPACPRCGGILKPDVVFFGAGVPRPRVDAALAGLSEAHAVLVVGSSLMAYSGYRFCERAREAGKPVVAINRGRTRADPLLRFKIDDDCLPALASLARELAH